VGSQSTQSVDIDAEMEWGQKVTRGVNATQTKRNGNNSTWVHYPASLHARILGMRYKQLRIATLFASSDQDRPCDLFSVHAGMKYVSSAAPNAVDSYLHLS